MSFSNCIPVRRTFCALQASALSMCLALLPASGAHAQAGDKNAEKAARRAQLQMQNLQQQVQEAQAAKAKVESDKAKVESDKAATDKQLGDQSKQLSQLRAALPRATQSLKAAEAERDRLAATVASLEKQLVEQKTAADETLAGKGREIVQISKARDEQHVLATRKFDEQVVNVGECTSKNDRLIRLNVEMLNRYRNKTAADVLKQREPALGFGDVQMFNLIQDYRDKADAERYSPPINR